MINLYDYQDIAVGQLRAMMAKGSKNLILTLPTGGGKTVVFSYMTGQAASKGMRVMILTDRTELNGQTEETLKNFGVESEAIKAGKTKTYHFPAGSFGEDFGAASRPAHPTSLEAAKRDQAKNPKKIKLSGIPDEVKKQFPRKVSWYSTLPEEIRLSETS